jgi:hypothetical protein
MATSDEPKKHKECEETFHVNGKEILKKVKDLIKEGNIRKIIIKDKDDKTILEIPLSLGVAMTVLAPVFAIIGTMAALITECSITVVREKK